MKEKESNIKNFWILILCVVTFSLGVVFGRLVNIPNLNTLLVSKSDVNMDLYWEVWGYLKNKYVEKDKVSTDDMLYGSIKGLVNSYGDSATLFLTPEETNDFNESNEGKYFEGIGAELGYENGSIIIVAPIDGSPAKAAGIRSGDYILAVDGQEIKTNENIYDVVERIRGEAGTIVKLKILHKGELESKEIEITRGEITVPSMTLSYVGENKDIALIDIARFTDASYSVWVNNWDNVVEQINEKGVKKVLIDLRGNPGGYFDAAVHAADDFLDKDIVIAKQQDGDGNVEEFKATKGGGLLNTEVVVLVDEGSASASEILSGSLQKNSRAKILGTKTYGKGTAQSVIDLSDGSSLHLTVLKWLLPDGSWLNRDNPITPDEIVENSTDDFIKGKDNQMNKALEILNN